MDDPSKKLDRIADGYSLPTLSPVAMRLVRMASEDNISVEDLTHVIEKDVSLPIRLLRLANSAFFRTGGSITTIEQAIQMVGFNRLRVMALSLSLKDTFPMQKTGPLDYELFWKSSLYRALLAKSLAHRLRTCKPDEAFVAGLVLEIGALVFYDIFVKGKPGNDKMQLIPLDRLLQWEREHYGLDHRQVGAAALKFWNFPHEIVDCQRFYYVGPKTPDISEIALVSEMAREFAELICEKTKDWQSSFNMAEGIYRVDNDIIADVLAACFDEVQEIAESLKVETNRQNDMLELVEKANRALSVLSDRMIQINEADSRFVLPTFAGLDNQSDAAQRTMQAVAHEIRNPLVTIGGFAKKLEKTLNPASSEWQYVRIIVEESVRLEQALDDLARKGRN
ncbi:MAG TPA: HDOD domain-containing protein [Dissulfurispiraceae bacterium]|nr:HDOD domain-containing protein [Dissulfurispiraceae bacterium]